MVFTPPSWVPDLPIDPPDSISIAEFMSNDAYGRMPLADAGNPFVCALTNKSYTATRVVQRERDLARAIAAKLKFGDQASEWDRVVTVFSFNTIDYIPTTHAIHRLSGIVALASCGSTAAELTHQLQAANSTAIFTCTSLLQTALEAAKLKGIPNDRIFVLPMHGDPVGHGFTTIDELIEQGSKLPDLQQARWTKRQGARQVAYLCFSSGTSGMPKAVMVSHQNVIANILQLTAFESFYRNQHGINTQVILGLLPFNHAYALIIMGHVSPYRGDPVIVLPKFELDTLLMAIQRFRVEQLNIVPPILIHMLANHKRCKKFDLSSVRFVYIGAAPLGVDTIQSLSALYPEWHLGQVYGMTETAVVATSTSESDIFHGSSGSLLPRMKAKLVDADGNEVTRPDLPGELLLQGPSLALGYLNNQRATSETWVWDKDGRWIRTGDEVVIRKSAQGHEHYFIVDRIKELIKVKGMQVAPAELEAHLLTHPFVSDCAVIQVHDDRSGEVPKAFVVTSREAAGMPDTEVAMAISKHVEEHKARYKWLAGGVEFLDSIPKNPSGKILRRHLRDRERSARLATGPRL